MLIYMSTESTIYKHNQGRVKLASISLFVLCHFNNKMFLFHHLNDNIGIIFCFVIRFSSFEYKEIWYSFNTKKFNILYFVIPIMEEETFKSTIIPQVHIQNKLNNAHIQLLQVLC